MMSLLLVIMLLMSISLVSSFTVFKNKLYKSSSLSSLSMINDNTLKNIIVSGFVSKANEIAESFVFSKLYEKVLLLLLLSSLMLTLLCRDIGNL